MKIVYMGTPEFAVYPLEALIKAGYEICAVVTQPDRKKGRGKELGYSPVKECALRYGIPVLQPVKIREEETVQRLKALNAHLYVVAAFGQILPEKILRLPEYGCINIHASLLPKYRGASPIHHAVLDGEKVTGVTIIQMEKGIDTGDMLLKEEIPIEEGETAESLHDKLAPLGAKLLLKVIPMIEQGTVIPEKQDDALSSHAGMLNKEMGRIDWVQPAAVIERLVRGLNSWPSAYTYYQGKMLKIWEAMVVEEETGEPGQVVRVSREYFDVGTGRGILRIMKLQPEGKRQMSAGEFLRGYELEPGMRFGQERQP